MSQQNTLQRKKLPIGVQTFAKIRGEDDYYYVDKTAMALKLIDEGSYYFLSRPRRFGKSLFLDTLAALFAGNEPLFRGLYCHDKWDWSVSYPVIRISFAEGRMESREQLDGRIYDLLRINRENLGVDCPDHLDIPGCFGELLRAAERKYGQRAVILVDEYDKPILDNLTKPELARAMREGLRNLYSVIKGQDAHIKFAFLTGVSKFSKVSIFSGLNNLRDITLSEGYSAICGYTDADVDSIFAPELEGLDRQEIRDWYNGYNWTGESVYNPFDLLLLFEEREFRPYWFETGTPTFLIEWLMAQDERFTPKLESWQTDLDLLGAFDVDDIEPEAMLWQTGYLTIASTRQLPGMTEVHLTLPNREVRASLNAALLRRMQDKSRRASYHLPKLYDLLMANDFAGLEQLFTSFFASSPHHWYTNNPIADYEGYYASIFYSHFAALGLDVVVEDCTNMGRIDMTVLFNGHVYLFEFKMLESDDKAQAGQTALKQLKDKDYAAKYHSRNEPIHLIGVEFSRQSRSVVGFALE
jgi:hypothetical protein